MPELAAMHPDRGDVPVTDEACPDPGDVPIDLRWDRATNRLRLIWLRSRHIAFAQPFFDWDIRDIRRRDPDCVLYATDLEAAARHCWDRYPLRPPACLVFHISHCGSTLASRLLGCMPGTVVVSEAVLVNKALRIGEWVEPGEARAVVSRLLPVLGHACLADKANGSYCVKLSSWNLLYFDLLRRAFPNVPCVFIYRDPRQVMASLVEKCRKRGGLFRHLHELAVRRYELGYGDPHDVSVEDECAQLLDVYFREFLTYREQFSVAIDHADIRQRIVPVMEMLLGRTADAASLARIARTFDVDAKQREPVRFRDDSERKTSLLTAAMTAAIERSALARYWYVRGHALENTSVPAASD